MRPFRSRALTALVMAILSLGLFGSVANADEIPSSSLSADPWSVAAPSMSFPEDPWPGMSFSQSSFPEDPWPGLSN
jgi:hypothetical protein